MSYTPQDPLGKELLRLARILASDGINITVGGGYGLFLKAAISSTAGERTRVEPIPFARSTTDLDFFLNAEIISSVEKCEAIRKVLDQEYTPIEGSQYWQFRRNDTAEGFERPIKVDLLASPPESTELRNMTSADARRIRPKGKKGILHARLTEEAVFTDQSAVTITLGDDIGQVEVFLPHPLAFLILKLNAVRDRIDDPLKGPYHAFDVYRIVAMMTEKEWNESIQLSEQLADHQQFKNAGEIVRNLFGDRDAMGTILARRFAADNNQPDLEITTLVDDLGEIFLR